MRSTYYYEQRMRWLHSFMSKMATRYWFVAGLPEDELYHITLHFKIDISSLENLLTEKFSREKIVGSASKK